MKLLMNNILAVALAIATSLATTAAGEIVYSQPHDGSNSLYQSSWFAPDESDYDQKVWDDFTLASSRAITEIRWRGGFLYGGLYAPTVADFTVEIYGNSIAGEPDITHPPLVSYTTAGNAGQTPAGTFGGTTMYDYHFTLPAAFQAVGGTKYWVHVYAAQFGVPEWAFARGSGGNNHHFRWIHNMYNNITGDVAVSLIASDAATFTITASASPLGLGTILGAGAYPVGSTASLVAVPNTGYAFVNWTENSQQVSASPNYSFVVTIDRTLVAHFTNAYAITTLSLPGYGGTTSGGGTYASGSCATVTATPNHGFVFTQWLDFGSPVSASATYTITVNGSHQLAAQFASAPQSTTFDMDNAPVHTSLPLDLTVDGLTGHFSGTGGGYSIQPSDTWGINPPGFSGLSIFPNSVFPADLLISFSQPLIDFSILYSPQELACDTSATMRVTAFMDATFIATDTMTAPNPGTYPSATLSMFAPAPFNHVVVHYDSPPATCQDWGPIFFADNVTVTRANAPCPADITGNGSVDVGDLLTVITNWGPCASPPCAADIAPPGGDGQINVSDLLAVITAWGACP